MKPPFNPTKILVMKNNPPVKSFIKTYCVKAICIFFLSLFSRSAFSQPCTPPIVDAPTVTQPTCASTKRKIIVFASGLSALEYSINGTTWQTSNTFGVLNSRNLYGDCSPGKQYYLYCQLYRKSRDHKCDPGSSYRECTPTVTQPELCDFYRNHCRECNRRGHA